MTRRSRTWWAVAAFTAINAAGAVYAELTGDPALHTLTHLALTVIGAAILWRLAPRRAALPSDAPALAADDPDRLMQLEQSIDAVAIEVERLGEGQRYMTQLMSKDGAPGPTSAKPPATPATPPDVRAAERQR